MKYYPWINVLGATTFGVLLIHANSDTMRQWLWRDMLDNAGHYVSGHVVMHACLSVLGVFMVCALIDYLRIVFLERNVFKWLDRILPVSTN